MAVSTGIPTGLYFLDNHDLWTTFGVAVRSGSADFLKYSPRKQPYSFDWQDQNGTDVDLSAPLFASRDINLVCGMMAPTEAVFLANRDALLTQLILPGLRTFSVTLHNKTYDVYYKDCSGPTQLRPMNGSPGNQPVFQFTLTLTEPNPSLNNTPTPLVDESGNPILI